MCIYIKKAMQWIEQILTLYYLDKKNILVGLITLFKKVCVAMYYLHCIMIYRIQDVKGPIL
jgi:hypothetical protein